MTIPNELLRSTPRPVTLTAQGKAFMVFVCFLILVAVTGGIWLYIRAEADGVHDRSRAARALTTEGRILTAEHRGGKDSHWVMKYSFTVGGNLEQGTATGPRKVEVGTVVVAHYMPNDLSDNWITGYKPRPLPVFLAPLFGVACLFAAGLIAFSVRRQMNLLSYGRAAVARVTGTKRVWHGEGGRHIRVQFEFRLRNGSLRKASVETGRKAPAVGTEFIIVYDSDQPKRFARYPASLVRI
jgi:hypothetical protein